MSSQYYLVVSVVTVAGHVLKGFAFRKKFNNFEREGFMIQVKKPVKACVFLEGYLLQIL